MTRRSDSLRGAGWRAGVGALGLASLLAAVSAPVRAEELVSEETKETASQGGMGAAAGLTSVVYAPLKVAYAAGGTVVAGLAYVLSGGDKDVAKPIFDASVRGDYVVTPEHMTGQRELEFVGRSRADEKLRKPAAAPDVSANKAADKGAGDSWQ